MRIPLESINMHSLEVWTVKELAKVMKVDEATIQRLAKANKLPCNKVGRSYRFLKSEIRQYLRKPYMDAVIKEFKTSLKTVK